MVAEALLAEPRVHAVVVALAADDASLDQLAPRLASPKLQTTIGGVNRQDTVANALEFLAARAAADDWMLVHDAARPCLTAPIFAPCSTPSMPGRIRIAGGGRNGAVLAAPIVDTVKRELGDHVVTVDRAGLWRALTPQVFAFAAAAPCAEGSDARRHRGDR